jgi:hypothetical protein
MITFKQYLQESAIGDSPNYKNLDIIKAVDLLKEKCKGSLWMFEENKFIYRGFRDVNYNYAEVDTAETERKSQNTKNYYTVILDNNPLCKGFPKRSRSFICSTDYEKATRYGETYIVVPTDGAKIGIVGAEDIFTIRTKLFNKDDNHTDSFYTLNCNFEEMDMPDNIDDFKNVDKILKNPNDKDYLYWVKKFQKGFGFYINYNNFLGDIWKAYSPKSTGFKNATGKTFKSKYIFNSEVWIEGEVILIKHEIYKKIKMALLDPKEYVKLVKKKDDEDDELLKALGY